LYWPARASICKPFKEPGIDSQPGGLVRQPYLLYRLARLHRLAESNPRNQILGIDSSESIPGLLKCLQIQAQATLATWLVPGNRFLGSLNVYKYRLRLHWLAELVSEIRRVRSASIFCFAWISKTKPGSKLHSAFVSISLPLLDICR
jgi:hypothetical protein